MKGELNTRVTNTGKWEIEKMENKRRWNLLIPIVLMATTLLTLWVYAPAKSAGDPDNSWVFWRYDLNNTGYSPFATSVTNASLWNFTTGDAPIYGTPVITNNRIFVGVGISLGGSSLAGQMLCLNQTDGSLIWNFTTYGNGAFPQGILDSAAVVNGQVYFGAEDGYVYALNANTGSLEWKTLVGKNVIGYVWSVGLSSPAVYNGVVVIGSQASQHVFALNATTGAVIWETLVRDTQVSSTAAISNGLVYINDASYYLYAINFTTGQIVWTFTTDNFPATDSSVAVQNGLVYYGGSGNDNMYALNATTGKTVWNYTTGNEIEGSPSIMGNSIFFGGLDGYVYALNSTSGALIWKYQTGGQIISSPALSNTTLYIPSNDRFLYALNCNTGALVWKYIVGGYPSYGLFSPSISGSNLYVGGYSPLLNQFQLFAIGNPAPSVSVLNPGPLSYSSGWNASSNVRYIGTSDFVFYSNETSSGSTFFMNITVSNVTNLYGWRIGLVYDNATLQYVSAWLPTDNVFAPLTSLGVAIVEPGVLIFPVNASYQEVVWGASYIMPSPTWDFNGTGTLAQIEFQIIAQVNSTNPQLSSSFSLDPAWTSLYFWPSGSTIPTSNAGNFVYEFPVHDVAVTSVAYSKTVVCQGYSLNVTVTAANLGNYTETFNVTIYANTTIISSENITLSSGSSTNVTFTCNTTGFAYGNYTISAYAWPVLGQTNTTQKSCTGGWVFVSLVGDVTGPNGWPDGKVDIRDVNYVARRYGTTPSSPNWTPNADINGDGKVDIRDVHIVVKNYGESVTY